MKTFTVAVVLTIVATLTVPNGVAGSGPGVPKYSDPFMESVQIPVIYALCPPNVTEDFDVIFDGEDWSTVKGCASLKFRSHNESTDLSTFEVLFGRLNNEGPRVCVSGDYAGMKELVASCVSPPATQQVKFDNEKVYRLYGDGVSPEGDHETRCIAYKVVNSALDMMAVSSNLSCGGLTRMMFYSHSNSTKGSTLMRLNSSGDSLRRRRSTSEDKNSTQLNFSGSRYFWRAGR